MREKFKRVHCHIDENNDLLHSPSYHLCHCSWSPRSLLSDQKNIFRPPRLTPFENRGLSCLRAQAARACESIELMFDAKSVTMAAHYQQCRDFDTIYMLPSSLHFFAKLWHIESCSRSPEFATLSVRHSHDVRPSRNRPRPR